jgi:N-acetylneuraminic acid mutarotase
LTGGALFLNACAMSLSRHQFEKLPRLPDPEGFAAMYAGVSGDTLVVAGGANFPTERPWEGGTKAWYDEIWTLASPAGSWKKAGHLPGPLAYGVSVSWRDEIICAGGSHAHGHTDAVFALKLNADGTLSRRTLPSLPGPCANLSGALLGDILYVAGGLTRPDATATLASFWSLDLSDTGDGWKVLPPCPGGPRMLATAGVWEDSFYLFSGTDLRAGPDGKPVRIWLKDAWRYTPSQGWTALPDLPRVAVAAPSPAPASPDGLLVLTGDDGSKAGFKPETDHPGFPRDILLFSPDQNRWSIVGHTPFSRATVPTAMWQQGWVLPSGEARPGYRSPDVWLLRGGR